MVFFTPRREKGLSQTVKELLCTLANFYSFVADDEISCKGLEIES